MILYATGNGTIVILFSGNYEATVKANQKELKESYSKITNFNNEEERVANEKDANKIRLEKLILLDSQNDKKVVERNEMIVKVAQLAGKNNGIFIPSLIL